jgi:hypothetical protein
LERIFDRKGGGVWDFTVGPQPTEIVAETINFGCLALNAVLVAFTQFVDDKEGNRDAARMLSAYAGVLDYITAQQQQQAAAARSR